MSDKFFIKNSEEFAIKIQKFRAAGASKIHVISDYDRTLTRAFIDGKKGVSSFDKIEQSGFLPDDYFIRARKMYDYYYPIELSTSISLVEKKKALDEWWYKYFSLFIEYGLTKKILDNVFEKSSSFLREGVDDLFCVLKKKDIPILIFSAGIANAIEIYLKNSDLLFSNVGIISNYIYFGSDGKANGCSNPMIHSFNKNELGFGKGKYHKNIESRSYVLLLGDTIGDSCMADGLAHKCVIKVCFMNKYTLAEKDKYADFFDVLILEDGSMEFVNELFKDII
jgi:5'-nucleotidase